MAVDVALLDRAIDAIKAEYGNDSIHAGGESPPVSRISTGSPELDYATGGGIPVGRWSRFYGTYSSGKSLTCWNVIRNAQELGLKCAYYNIEKQFDEFFVASRGVDIDELLLVPGTIIEEVGTKCEALLSSVHLHVFDSCSQAISIDELACKPGDWRPGIGPRAWGKVFRRINERFDDVENTIILVDQVRKNWDTKADEPPGGKNMEHVSSMTLQFKRGKWLFYNKDGVLNETGAKTPDTLSKLTEADGQEVQVLIKKSRVGRPFRQARLHLDFKTMEFDTLFELAKAAKYFGIVADSSNGRYSYGDTKFVGMPALREGIAADRELQEVIKDAMLTAACS